MGNLVGRSLAHFRIEAELGERGMGIHPLSSARRWAGKLLLVFLLFVLMPASLREPSGLPGAGVAPGRLASAPPAPARNGPVGQHSA